MMAAVQMVKSSLQGEVGELRFGNTKVADLRGVRITESIREVKPGKVKARTGRLVKVETGAVYFRVEPGSLGLQVTPERIFTFANTPDVPAFTVITEGRRNDGVMKRATVSGVVLDPLPVATPMISRVSFPLSGEGTMVHYSDL